MRDIFVMILIYTRSQIVNDKDESIVQQITVISKLSKLCMHILVIHLIMHHSINVYQYALI